MVKNLGEDGDGLTLKVLVVAIETERFGILMNTRPA